LVLAVSFGWFAWRFDSEPEFVDESSAIATSYYFRLLARGELHHVDWLHPGAYDHVPVFKYLIGLALRLSGQQPPDSIAPWEQWMQRTFEPSQHPGIARALRPARLIAVLGAAVGCAMMFLVGRMLVGVKTGIIAAGLLALSPLYATHARRAMADDWTQAFVLTAIWAILASARLIDASSVRWSRLPWWLLAAGAVSALAAGTRLNGASAPVALGVLTIAVLVLAAVRRGDRTAARAVAGRLALMTAVVGCVAAVVFIAINPFFYARPDLAATTSPDADGTLLIGGHRRTPEFRDEVERAAQLGIVGRTRLMLAHRAEGLAAGQLAFPHLAIASKGERLQAIVAEGLGRWFAFGSGQYIGEKDRRSSDYHVVSGWGVVKVVFWLLCLLVGLRTAWQEGRDRWRRGQIPIEWLLVTWTAVEVGVLLRNLVVDFDRYYLGAVTIASLLVPYGVAGALRRIHDQLVLRPPTPEDRL
jgi:4-amino-4-deoxy-L-arabinose transferase-like glycosyltransferase